MKLVFGNLECVFCVDFLVLEGYGEIIGGLMCEDDYDVFVVKMDELGMDKLEYDFYFDFCKYGFVFYGGFGIGIECMVIFVVGIKYICEVILFLCMLYCIKL